jgi:tetratricopeptide (TPR) repeat protein
MSWEIKEFESFAPLRRALAIRERALGTDHPDVIGLAQLLASYHQCLSGFEAAESLWRRVLASMDRAAARGVEVEQGKLRYVLGRLGKTYNALNRHADAERTWWRWLALPEQVGLDDPCCGLNGLLSLDAHYGAGRAAIAQGKWAEAEPLLRLAVAAHRRFPRQIVSESDGAIELGFDAGLFDYARALHALHRPAEAASLLEEAPSIHLQSDSLLLLMLREYAAVLRKLQRSDEVAKMEAQADVARAEVEEKEARRAARLAAWKEESSRRGRCGRARPRTGR